MKGEDIISINLLERKEIDTGLPSGSSISSNENFNKNFRQTLIENLTSAINKVRYINY